MPESGSGGWRSAGPAYRATILTFLGVLFCSTCFFINLPILPLLYRQLPGHQPLWMLGPILSVTFILAGLASPVWGKLSDRYGQRAMMIRASVLLAVAFICTPLAHNAIELLGVRCLNGLASGYIPAAMAYLTRMVSEERVGRTLGYISMARSAGALVGPAVGGVLVASFGFDVPFEVAAGLMLASTAFAFSLRPDQVIRAEPLPNAGELSRNKLSVMLREPGVVWLLGAFGAVAASGIAVQTLIPLRLGSLRQSPALWSGVAFSIAGAASIALAYPWGSLTDRYRPRRLLVTVLGVGIATSGAMAAVDSAGAVVGIYAVYAVFLCEVNTILSYVLTSTTSSGNRGKGFGLSNTANQLGLGIGPLAATGVADLAGTGPAFLLGGFMYLLALALMTGFYRAAAGVRQNAATDQAVGSMP